MTTKTNKRDLPDYQLSTSQWEGLSVQEDLDIELDAKRLRARARGTAVLVLGVIAINLIFFCALKERLKAHDLLDAILATSVVLASLGVLSYIILRASSSKP